MFRPSLAPTDRLAVCARRLALLISKAIQSGRLVPGFRSNSEEVKQNDDYVILRAAIEQYLDESAFVKAMTLMQKYGEHMHSETVSFQERYGFVAKEFVEWQRKVAASEYGTARELQLFGRREIAIW